MFKKKSLLINAYLSYGTTGSFVALGRALEDENINFEGNTKFFKTLRDVFKQLESDEIKNSDLQIHLSDGQVFNIKTDAEGYYKFIKNDIDLKPLMDLKGWVSYTISYKNIKDRKISDNNIFEGKMLIPSTEATYGIISDIDDTVLHTGVASLFKWRLITNTFFKNFDRRLPLEGTSEFYQKLQLGTVGKPVNPLFYVSNSPWNLFNYLKAFLLKNHLPDGPILLRDFRSPFDKTPKPKVKHKRAEILNLLKTYPDLKFVLIGDSGERDADIYTKIANEHPSRILAIYLRNVNSKRRERRILKIIQNFDTVPILLVNKAKEAEDHAKKLGLLTKL